MKRKYLRIIPAAFLLAILILGTLSIGVSAATETPTQRENYTAGGDGDADATYGTTLTAMQFTTATSHTVTSIMVKLKRVGANTGCTLKVSLREAAAAVPTGIDLAYATLLASTLTTSYAWYTFEITETSLEAAHQYAIVISDLAGDGSNYVMWQKDTGGGIADAAGSHSTDGGANWTTDAPEDNLFEIWGNDTLAIKSVGIFQSFYEDNDLLIVLELKNIIPPYFTTVTPYKYFQVQLLDTDDTTVLASSAFKMFGYKPASIYLSAASAVAITIGGDYHILVTGINGVTDSDDYALVAADWHGNDLTYLDEYVRVIATNMGDYYSENYLSWSVKYGQLLTADGGDIFLYGIPRLDTQRPNLFAEIVSDPKYVETTPINNFDVGSYDIEVGADVVDRADALGTVLGVTGQDALAMIVVLIMVAVAALIIIMGGDAMIAMLLVSGLAFGAARLQIINLQWILLPAALFVLMFARKLWLKAG